MKFNKNTLRTAWRSNFSTYGLVLVLYGIMMLMQAQGSLSRLMKGMLVPLCVYAIAAISLNLTVGVLGELSLGHAGFMSIGCFTSALTIGLLRDSITSETLLMIIGIVVGALCATLMGFLVGLPVLRLNGDYLAIVTLACGEIIKSLLTNLYVGKDESGIHVNMFVKTMEVESKNMLILGPQGIKNDTKIAGFTLAVIVLLLCLVLIDNLIGSKAGRAIMAVRDNKIAARSVGIDITKYKMMAFVLSAAMAGAAGALFGQSQSAVLPSKFDFNTSILVLVFVVLGGLGNMRGSVIAAILLTILPEKLRFLDKYRMIVYALVLIFVMLIRNTDILFKIRNAFKRLTAKLGKKDKKKPTAAAKEVE